MHSRLYENENDLRALRGLIERAACGIDLTDLEESMQIASVRARTRLWEEDSRPIGFCWVDGFNNLRYGIEPECASPQLEGEILAWALAVAPDREATLDASCESTNTAQIAWLESHGFQRGDLRTLHYARPLLEPIPGAPLPTGFSIRPVRGESEVESLVELHRAAFGTQNMTVEERLAIMRTPVYARDLDLLAVSPEGELAAFCICSMDPPEIGWTDPIGVRPRYQRVGLGRAIVTAGLCLLQSRGAREARLGTSSENLPMQRLAECLGFTVISERLWFSRELT